MKKPHADLAPAYIKELFNYDPETGVLSWKKMLSSRGAPGKEAGCLDDQDRVRVGIHDKIYMAHRLIWVWMTGHWPASEIDHRDGKSFNNRWKNLREATHSQNQHNKTVQKNNTSGYKGVSYHTEKKRWIAEIKLHGRRYKLGRFQSAKAAHAAYCSAAKRLHGDFRKTK